MDICIKHEDVCVWGPKPPEKLDPLVEMCMKEILFEKFLIEPTGGFCTYAKKPIFEDPKFRDVYEKCISPSTA